MSMPTQGDPWPPSKTLADHIDRWSDWWTANPITTGAPARDTVTWRLRPSQFAGGLVGASSRALWGRPPREPGAGQAPQPAAVHVPLAADLADASASLLLGQPPTVTVTGTGLADDDPLTRRLDRIHQSDHTRAALTRGAEAAAALGGCVLRCVHDATIGGTVILDAVAGVHVHPEIRWGVTIAVTIATPLRGLDTSEAHEWLHVEHHEVTGGTATITHALHEWDQAQSVLGVRRAVTDHPDTRWLAGPGQPAAGEDGAVVMDTGQPLLTAVYVPNRAWRGSAPLPGVGRADIDGLEGPLAALDLIVSALTRDVRLGQAMILAPDHLLTDLGPGQGAAWDPVREVIVGLTGDPRDSPTGMGGDITTFQPEIRHESLLAAADALTRIIVRGAGYSPSTLGLSDDVVQTATEVTASTRGSLRTRDAKARIWGQALARILAARASWDGALQPARAIPAPAEWGDGDDTGAVWEVEWPAADQDPMQVRAATVELLARAKSASLPERVRLLHPEWTPAQVDEEVTAIEAETPAAPDPLLLDVPATQPDPDAALGGVPPDPSGAPE